MSARRNRQRDPRHPKTHLDPDNAPTAVEQTVAHTHVDLGVEGRPQKNSPAQSSHCPFAKHPQPTPESPQGRWAGEMTGLGEAVARVTQS
jgi:hypothetical protein